MMFYRLYRKVIRRTWLVFYVVRSFTAQACHLRIWAVLDVRSCLCVTSERLRTLESVVLHVSLTFHSGLSGGSVGQKCGFEELCLAVVPM